jgi:tripartite-type tricarboxylate transporter receptor subunit TctC
MMAAEFDNVTRFAVGCVKICLMVFGLCYSFLPSAVWAQNYPVRSIRLVVPFPAGGATDTIARTFGAALSEQLGRPIVVDNKGGAGGTLGVADAARAPADGYTILIGEPGGLAIGPSFLKGIVYDPVRDFIPIGQVVSVPMMLVSHPSLPARSLTELLALAKAKPASFTYGSPGSGTVQHLASEQLRLATGLDLVHVPYKGGGPAMNDLLGGQIALMMITIPTVATHIRAGKIIGLAVLSRERDPALPNVQTVAQAGYRGFEEGIWQGFFAPAGTPREIVDRLNTEVRRAAATPEVRDRLQGIGAQIVTGSPEALGEILRSDLARWAQVLKASGVGRE